MSKTEASVYIVGWICFAIMASVLVKSCSDNITQNAISIEATKQQEYQGRREDCNKAGGLLVRSWGDWECKLK